MVSKSFFIHFVRYLVFGFHRLQRLLFAEVGKLVEHHRLVHQPETAYPLHYLILQDFDGLFHDD